MHLSLHTPFRFRYALTALLPAALLSQASAAPLSLLDTPAVPSGEQVTASQLPEGLKITIEPGNSGYPGVSFTPDSKLWDLSAYGHVEARLVNLGTKPTTFCLRIDDNGDWKTNPWNAENLRLMPGATGTVKIVFGYSYNFQPSYKLKSDSISKILLFSGKVKDAPVVFRVESLVAAGEAGEKPPVDPRSVRIFPPAGVILSAQGGVAALINAQKAQATWSGPQSNGTLRLSLPDGVTEGRVTLKPPVGCWNLRDGNQLVATLRNDGSKALTATVVLANDGTKTDPVSASLAPGERQTLSIPFASKKLWDGNEKNTGTSFASDRANKITISIAGEKTGTASLTAESLVVNLAPAVHPDWLGKRPPVEGSWKMTFQDEFNGTAIDTNNWSYYGENYWDKMTTHFSKETTYVKDGTARLRLEKKRGHHNDDPSRPESDYATGFLETYGKFTQRYGYFEARMKLPTAPGLWPAFWMMPDRGGPAGTPQWQRSDTKNGGMEFDIMEHLTRWGVNRYSIANHWNGYGKEHQANGTSVYYTPDQDGFITSGVLWTPGEVVYFCQGREIGRWKTDRIMNVPAHIIFTLPSGGWDNDRLDDTKLPGEFLIDYVRVWQRADLLDK